MACQRTQDKLDELLKEYNDAKKDFVMKGKLTDPVVKQFLTEIFNQNFVEGSEAKPKCNSCQQVIAHPNHAAAAAAGEGHAARPVSSASPRHDPSLTVVIGDDISVPSSLTSPVPQRPKSCNSEEQLQAAYDKFCSSANATIGSTTLRPGKGVTLTTEHGNIFPDVVLFAEGHETVAGIAAIIELKVSKPTDADRNQLLDYLRAVLMAQPSRQLIYGIVTDNKAGLRVYSAVRTRTDNPQKDPLRYNEHYAGDFDKKYIQWLRESTLVDLGFVMPTVTIAGKEFKLLEPLGSGQHSIGYALTVHDKTIVVKHFREMKYADVERNTCTALKGCANVSQLHADQPTDKLFVAITPRGHRFDKDSHKMTETHVRQLSAAVSALHAKKRVHGDICEQNIFWVAKDNAMLNDWSHVTETEDAVLQRKDFRMLSEAVQSITRSDVLADIAEEPVRKKARTE
jgi:hypothetical protein